MTKRSGLLAALLLPAAALHAADVNITVVTPSRAPQNIADVAGAVEVLLPAQLAQAGGTTLDQKLQTLVPGLTSNRGAGLYTHGSELTMRGLPGGETGQAMTLVLLDGVPLNSAATGGVQWNSLKNLDIDHIEVFKGPGSSMYGSNAMAGSINIITKKAKQGYSLETSYGTYNTFSAAAKAGVTAGKLSLEINGNYLSSDGYNQTPKSARNAFSIKSDVLEKSAGAKAAYAFEKFGNLSLDYGHFKGCNGAGSNKTVDQYREKEMDRVQAGWQARLNGYYWNLTAFYNDIADLKVSEKSGTAIYADIKRRDFGGLASVAKTLDSGLIATGGLDYKFGVLDAHDSNNSPSAAPFSFDRGKTDNIAPYAQLEKDFAGQRLNVAAGLRYDNVFLHDAFSQNTSAAQFTPYNGKQPDKRWAEFSPKVSVGWKYSGALTQYLSYAKGFRSPTLESMTLNLKRGTKYQLANPGLTPETAYTAETGIKFNPVNGLYLDPDIYLTEARDFIYYTQVTGNYYQYKNMARAEIYGVEIPVKYISGGLALSASCARSHSRVTGDGGLGIKGRQLTYAPGYLYSAGAAYERGNSALAAAWTHKSKQYTNEANTSSLPGYSTAALTFTQKIKKDLVVSLSCDNVFNEVYTESDSVLSPGRTFTGTVRVTF
ncbi:MAG TPA: TonB-dependent receptor [Elusimicrobiales bacterium]|mgnify:CR=1 FL=1|nr:TonB-dependent receptor [Elusimicrobiales bacterium]